MFLFRKENTVWFFYWNDHFLNEILLITRHQGILFLLVQHYLKGIRAFEKLDIFISTLFCKTFCQQPLMDNLTDILHREFLENDYLNFILCSKN